MFVNVHHTYLTDFVQLVKHTRLHQISTVNARISAQLQISAPLRISALLRLKICNKLFPSNMPPPPPPLPQEKNKFRYSIRYTVHTVLLIKGDIVNRINIMSFQSRTGLLLSSLIEISMSAHSYKVFEFLCCSLV